MVWQRCMLHTACYTGTWQRHYCMVGQVTYTLLTLDIGEKRGIYSTLYIVNKIDQSVFWVLSIVRKSLDFFMFLYWKTHRYILIFYQVLHRYCMNLLKFLMFIWCFMLSIYLMSSSDISHEICICTVERDELYTYTISIERDGEQGSSAPIAPSVFVLVFSPRPRSLNGNNIGT